MNWLPRIVVLALAMALVSPAFAESLRSAEARQKVALAQRQSQQRLALARIQAAKKQVAQATAIKKQLPKQNSSQKQRTPTSRGLDQNNAAAGLFLGAVLFALSGNGGGFDFNAANVQDDFDERFERNRRYRMEYYQDRARREADAGNFYEAERSLQSGK